MNIAFLIIPKASTKYIDYNSSLRQATEKLNIYRYTAVPVLDSDGYYKGNISSGDILSTLYENDDYSKKFLESHKIKKILDSREAVSVNITSTISEVVDKLLDSNFVAVVDDRGIFVGIITRKYIFNYLMNSQKELEDDRETK